MNIFFSIDDVISSLLWLERTSAKSIFDSYTFAFAKWLYKEYQISTTCNCLYSDGINNLSMVSSKFKKEFELCSEWLKFSFHGYNYEKSYAYADYDDTMRDIKVVESEIIRICGKNSLSKTIRTHFYSGSEMALNAWKDAGVEKILTADDNRHGIGINYGMNEEEICDLNVKHSIKKAGIQFVRTDIRLENPINNIALVLCSEFDDIVVFTHERFINEAEIKSTLKKMIEDIRVKR